MASKTVDWLVASAHVLDSAQTVKAATWQEAAGQVMSGHVMTGRLLCIPVAAVQRFRIETIPDPTITAE